MNGTHDLRSVRWRKSSYSNADGGSCVEIADGVPGIVPVRDSKTPVGPVLLISPDAWTAFIRHTPVRA
ncbi:DUF397 domain-containing protein [Streptomyces sp. HUCO-GS316]|uniref:DUF397 domain-containing protein n=1 Tax=Streptomyces sp. HUCO-GS316 TaxID=2692198 RepID=UPI00136B69A4|nr:DUF397 domain-containing protein [Streptomyces sp. HUCO-GS316]MXM68808.1 DUF397 domain-containing protein [Streptomyces sp. HUCO-GS316]